VISTSIWGVKYTYIEGQLKIDWESVWHPRYPYESFDQPEEDAKISMDGE
jgi:hypothetical protein